MQVYCDTSAVGGCFDPEFRKWSEALWQEFIIGKKTAVFSDLTLLELEQAPEQVRKKLEEIPEAHVRYLLLDDEARVLALHYIQENVVSEQFLLDCQHIALATVQKVDVLVSWNFKHIVNYNRIRLYNAVNIKVGYNMLEIRSPREVIDG